MKSLFIILLLSYLFQNTLSYNPKKAIAYAQKWYNRRNPSYADYSGSGGDCANFVSQCLIAGGLSFSGCEGTYGTGGTIPLVTNLEKCLVRKGWSKSSYIPSGGFPAGGVIAFNNGQHTVLCVQGGFNPLVAGHTNDEWMGSSNWGTRTYYWDPKASSAGSGDSGDSGSGSVSWFPQVTGYNIYDSNNGFAGDYGRPVVALKVNKGSYRVHETGGSWLGEVSSNKVAGNGRPIDGVAISGGVRYRVHIMGGGWLEEVNGYNINDAHNGYAGILGRTIDAIAISGRTYASGY